MIIYCWFLPVAASLVSKLIFSLIATTCIHSLLGVRDWLKQRGRTHSRMFPFKLPKPKTECKIPSCTFPSPLPLPVSSYAPPLLAIVFPLPLFWSALPPPASFSPRLPAGAAAPAAAGAGRGCEPGGHASASAGSPQRPSGAAGSSSRSMLGSSFGLLQHWIAPSDTSSWKQNHTFNASLSRMCSAFLMPLHTDHTHSKVLFKNTGQKWHDSCSSPATHHLYIIFTSLFSLLIDQ